MKCGFENGGICRSMDCPSCGAECPVPEIDGICRHEDRREEYKLTPNGCAMAAFMKAGLDLGKLEVFWEEFCRLMERDGYVQEA